MKNKICWFLLIILFAASATGCHLRPSVSELDANAEDPSAVSPNQETPAPTSATQDITIKCQEEAVLDCTYDDSGCEPWQIAYAALMWDMSEKGLLLLHSYGKIASIPQAEETGLSDTYNIYDIDKDGIPELFIKRIGGTDEASMMTDV